MKNEKRRKKNKKQRMKNEVVEWAMIKSFFTFHFSFFIKKDREKELRYSTLL
jgi:hypothetical protein